MKLKFVTSLVIGLGLFLMVSIAPAATFDIRGGQLFGASGVNVNGVLYDVAFRDGTATAIPDAFLVSMMNHHILLLSDFTGV